MTGQQIFYQLLQCCPYDKTGFDAEEWESICQMAGAGLDSWSLVKIMSKGKPIYDSWMFRLIDSYYAPKKNTDGILARCKVNDKWLQLVHIAYGIAENAIQIKHGKGKGSLIGGFVYSPIAKYFGYNLQKIKAMFSDDIF